MDPDRSESISTSTRRRFLAGLLAVGGAVAVGSGPLDPARNSEPQAGPPLDPPRPESEARFRPEPAGAAASTATAGSEATSGATATATPSPFLDAVALDCDVCVVGGGAAGCAAAVSAARSGVRTVLLEESFVLGGNTTRGLVSFDLVTYGGDRPLVRGFFQEIIRDMESRGEAVYPSADTRFSVPYDPDDLRRTLLATALRAGVDVRLGTRAVRVTVEDRGIAAVWASEQGRALEVRATTYVDCTGDGHLGFLAGNGYWFGDDAHKQIQGQTLIFYAGPVDFERLAAFSQKNGSLVHRYQVVGLRDVIAGAVAGGLISGTPQHGVLINKTMREGVVSISGSETYRNHLEPGTAARIAAELEEQDYQIHQVLREQVPGFEESSITRLADRPYLREGRRLIGYQQLTGDQVLAGAKPPNSIARGWYPIDLHVAYKGGPVQLGHPRSGDWYGIPYGCLVARDLDNLLVAGRCISATHEALGSSRISPVSMSLGQAAGVAAAFASKGGKRPKDVNPGLVQSQVLDQGGLI